MSLPDLQGALWAWVQSLPAWQSDLLRRLTLLDEVREDEPTDALRMVAAASGGADPEHPSPAPVPIPALIAPVQPSATKIVALRDLVEVGSVEAGQRLDFGSTGLTIVFGETGSGKSSYARVLRKACRSSAKPVEILPNVLKSGPAQNQAKAGSAQIDVVTNDVASVIRRDVNAVPEPDLAQISVFDADCASVYAEEESEITYTPSSLRLLERLVTFQTQIKKRIDEEIARLEGDRVALDGFDQTTKAGALVAALNENVNPQTITALATVSDEEKKRLTDLRAQLAAAAANDPLRASTELQRRADGAERLMTEIGALAKGLDPQVVSDLVSVNVSIAELAAQSASLSASLSQISARPVGGTEWKGLWQAAHAYVAHSGVAAEKFPPESGVGRTTCPLCQQALSSEAVVRLNRFEEFFRGEVERQTRATAARRSAMLEGLAKLPRVDELSNQTSLVLAGESVLEVSVLGYLKSAAARRLAIEAAASASTIQAPPLASDPLGPVQKWIADLRKKAAEQRALAAPDAIAKAKREVAELESRLVLVERLGGVLGRIASLKRSSMLRRASAALTTTGLSRKIGDFTENAVTGQLRARLVLELEALQCSHLPVTIGARGIKGKTRVSIQLDATRDVSVKDVLSEGERRALALAFFLAEVAASEHGGGIILDDPVSSLDHARRSYVARRLVEEAARRQTIVFTHDVVLLLELQELAERAQVGCELRVVRRVGASSGIAAKELPWVAQNVAKRIGYLRNELQRLGALERKGDADAYRHAAKTWFELLREAWERTVPACALGGDSSRVSVGEGA